MRMVLSGMGAVGLGAPSMPPMLKLAGIGDINMFAAQIQQVEGYFPPGTTGYPNGSIAWQNNNPGNLAYTSYYGQAFGAVPGTPSRYSKFPDYATGYAALLHQIGVDAGAGLTIQQMMNKYAPASDGNNPTAYAATIANALGASVNDPVASVIGTDAGTPVDTASGPDLLADDGGWFDTSSGGLSMGLVLSAVAGLLLLDVVRG